MLRVGKWSRVGIVAKSLQLIRGKNLLHPLTFMFQGHCRPSRQNFLVRYFLRRFPLKLRHQCQLSRQDLKISSPFGGDISVGCLDRTSLSASLPQVSSSAATSVSAASTGFPSARASQRRRQKYRLSLQFTLYAGLSLGVTGVWSISSYSVECTGF